MDIKTHNELSHSNTHQITQQAVQISLSKFIGLSMPMADLVMLSWWAADTALADYALITQLVQVFVVLALALSVGVPIYINRHNSTTLATRHAIGYAYLLISTALTPLLWLYFYALDALHAFTAEQTQVYAVLAIGVISLPCYIVLNHILDTLNKSRQMIYLTVVLTLINISLNYQLLFGSFSAQTGIAIATTVVRILGLVLLFVWVGRLLGKQAVFAKFHLPAIKKLMDFGKADMLTGLIFTLGFALVSFYLNARFDEKLVGEFGIFLNMINLSFVVYVGFASALAIHLSKLPNQPIKLYRQFNEQIDRLIAKFITTSLMVGMFLSPVLSLLYFKQSSFVQIFIVLTALLVAALDGLAIATIAKLRVAGDTKKPPLFRLLLVVFGLPLGGWLLSMAGLFGVGIAFIIANACSVIALKVYQKRLLL